LAHGSFKTAVKIRLERKMTDKLLTKIRCSKTDYAKVGQKQSVPGLKYSHLVKKEVATLALSG